MQTADVGPMTKLAIRSPELARIINPTVRTALIIMPALFAFGYRAQHAMNACAQRHHHYVAQQAG